MGKIRAITRLILFALGTLFYIFRLMVLNLIYGKTLEKSLRYRTKWAKGMEKILGVRLHIEGKMPEEQVVITPNHRSYIDGAILSSLFVGPIVVKAEVGDWPIIGWGANVTQIILVDRRNRESLKKTDERIRFFLREGFPASVYPEGTTFEGPGIKVFKTGIFKIAVQENIPVLPIAIEYADRNDAWIGTDTFLQHFLRCFGKKRIDVYLKIGQPIAPKEDPVALKKETESWIIKALGETQNEL